MPPAPAGEGGFHTEVCGKHFRVRPLHYDTGFSLSDSSCHDQPCLRRWEGAILDKQFVGMPISGLVGTQRKLSSRAGIFLGNLLSWKKAKATGSLVSSSSLGVGSEKHPAVSDHKSASAPSASFCLGDGNR